MAVLFHSDLVDGGGRGATTLDEVDAALSGWVFRLLADDEVQARSARLRAPAAGRPGRCRRSRPRRFSGRWSTRRAWRPGTESWRDAVEAALLGDWGDVLGVRMSGDAEVMELLGRHARVEHLHFQPIWERKVRGRRLRLLEDPVAEGLTLGDLVTDRRLPEDAVLGRLEDDRVAAVPRCLGPGERAVAEVYAASRVTWSQAAETVRAVDPAAFGERVRTKLKRPGRRRQARAAAAAVRSAAGGGEVTESPRPSARGSPFRCRYA